MKNQQQKLFPNFMLFLEEKNNIKFIIENNSIIAEIGTGFDKFNEITIKLISQALINFFKSKNLKFLKFLIANDGSNKYMPILEKNIANVISCQENKAYIFNKHEPIHEAFLKFSADLTDDFSISIFLRKYDKQKYALSFFNKNNDFVPNEVLKNVIEEYKKIEFSDVVEFDDEPEELDFKKVLNEYTKKVLQKNFTSGANHVLKIGVINTKLQNSFVKKILGKNDIAYTILNNRLKEDKPKKIKYSLVYLSVLKNIEYIFKFSYDYRKLYIYKRNYSKKITIEYELLDISDLVVNYLSFLNNYVNTNQEFTELSKVFSSNFVKKENLSSVCTRYKLEYANKWIVNFKNIYPNNDAIYFDEAYHLLITNTKNYGYDAFVLLSVFVDMFNYYKTQDMHYNDIIDQNLDLISKLIITEFEYDCDTTNVSDFETKLFIQDSIAQIKVLSIEDIKNYYKDNYKYIAKFNFNEKEWMGLKYDFKNKKIIFTIQETISTKGNMAKKIKKYMSRFTKKYVVPLLDI
ncbi:hypothetical protein DMC14_000295 [Metamycoplasma phocicerebrale]|uniref:Uncharacterized protein n=1 Tax=Metamycoplasma phocicerebrale TaxID=142649 RepID=A0A3Q9V526_9BACT|nr:hypothetical protein [Metamycoplasma phocicerebrale]AZZ65250.1 hypothetical protein DMC14_000295 [Metamycoplasma phocicerebrale]